MQGPFPTFKPAVSEKRDYYAVLGVARDVEAGELKRAYRKLAVQYHPDRNPGDHTAEAKFKEAAEAYEVLCDPEKRALYDRYGHEGLQRGGFGGFRDVSDVFSAFSDIFGDLFGGGGRASVGADIEAEVEPDAGRGRHRRHQGGGVPPPGGVHRVRRLGGGEGHRGRDLPAVPRPGPGGSPAGLSDDHLHLPALRR